MRTCYMCPERFVTKMETIALLIRESSKFDESISSIAHMYQPGTNLNVNATLSFKDRFSRIET